MTKKTRKMPKYPPKPKGGQPTKLNEEMIEKIVAALIVGNYFETSCAMAGIHKDTAYEWLKIAAKDSNEGVTTLHTKFSDAVAKAQADAEGRDVMVIDITAHGRKAEYDKVTGELLREAVPRNWQAAAWRLERKFPKRWGRLDRIAGEDGGPVKVHTFVDLIKQLEAEEEEDD